MTKFDNRKFKSQAHKDKARRGMFASMGKQGSLSKFLKPKKKSTKLAQPHKKKPKKKPSVKPVIKVVTTGDKELFNDKIKRQTETAKEKHELIKLRLKDVKQPDDLQAIDILYNKHKSKFSDNQNKEILKDIDNRKRMLDKKQTKKTINRETDVSKLILENNKISFKTLDKQGRVRSTGSRTIDDTIIKIPKELDKYTKKSIDKVVIELPKGKTFDISWTDISQKFAGYSPSAPMVERITSNEDFKFNLKGISKKKTKKELVQPKAKTNNEQSENRELKRLMQKDKGKNVKISITKSRKAGHSQILLNGDYEGTVSPTERKNMISELRE
jgi:hypothetical protein